MPYYLLFNVILQRMDRRDVGMESKPDSARDNHSGLPPCELKLRPPRVQFTTL